MTLYVYVPTTVGVTVQVGLAEAMHGVPAFGELASHEYEEIVPSPAVGVAVRTSPYSVHELAKVDAETDGNLYTVTGMSFEVTELQPPYVEETTQW